MAISPKAKYPAQTNVADPAYPYGKARNVNTAGDGSGTPLEADWVNDIFGFQQALLTEAGITPSNYPDQVGTSQYLDAIKAVIRSLMTKTVVDKHINTPLWVFKGQATTNYNFYGGADEFNIDDPRQYDTILIPISSLLPDNAKITAIRFYMFSTVGAGGARVDLKRQTNNDASTLSTTMIMGSSSSGGYSDVTIPAGGVQLAGGVGCWLMWTFPNNLSGKTRIARCLVSYSVTPS